MADLLGTHFISLALVFLFAIRLSSQRAARDTELRYFWITVVCSFLLVLEDYLESLCSLEPALIFWRTLLSVAGYVLRSTAAASLLFVVLKQDNRNRGVWWIPCLIVLAVCSTAFFTDIAFGFDETYKFYRGPLGYVAFIVPFFYLLMILIMTFRHYVDNRKRTDRLILVSCVALCVISAILDATHGGVRLNEAIMISSIFFYVFLRSYDIRRDSLTSILNRQSLYEDAELMKRDVSAVASLDMNGLKIMNDRQGHQSGDAALKKIGDCLREISGQDVRSYRIGGDEFVVLFFGLNEAEVRKTLEDLSARVTDAGYSIAWGYAMRGENDSPETMFQRSDLKMFEQKAQYYREKSHDRRRARREKEDRYPVEARKSLEESPLPLAVYQFGDHRVETLLVSDGFCRLFGYPDRTQAVHILDRDIVRDLHPDDQERFSGAILRFSGGEDLDIVYRTRAGMESDYRVVHARGTHLHTGTGARVAQVWYMDEGVYIEGDEESGTLMNQALNRALHEESILNAMHYDELTGLPTLSWFFMVSDARKTQIYSEGKRGALLYIDLSGMKYFNHNFGFAEGDKLLKAFSEILAQIFGKENSCHIAADRFATTTTEDALEEQLQRLFDGAAKINGGNTLPVRVGVYCTSLGDVTASSAFDRAILACDAIRQSDVSCFNYYREEMRDAFRKRQYVVSNLDRAIREKWIQVYYQPIVSAADETVCDEEALARWADPEVGFLAPEDFVPYLESTSLIYKLDLFVLEQALEKIRLRQAAGQPVVPQSINLSRSDFETCDMVEEIRKRVDALGVDHSLITIEITESIIASNFDFMNEQVNRFRENGFAVWMDDFGSGYSSLDVLHSIHFDLIKFDMSFLRMLDSGDNARIILAEMMKMATLLKLDTICEGVEKEEHVRFLKEIGCSKLQGFYFGKPVLFGEEDAPPESDGSPVKPD